MNLEDFWRKGIDILVDDEKDIRRVAREKEAGKNLGIIDITYTNGYKIKSRDTRPLLVGVTKSTNRAFLYSVVYNDGKKIYLRDRIDKVVELCLPDRKIADGNRK